MTAADLGLLRDGIDRSFMRRRLLAFAVPGLLLVYLAYVFVAFDMAGLWSRLRWDNMATFLSDSYSYKTHVTRNNRTGDVTVAIEGERKGTYAPGHYPDWVVQEGGDTRVALKDGVSVTFAGDTLRIDIPGEPPLVATRGDGIALNRDPAGIGWISYSPTRLDARIAGARVSMTRARTEVFRYFPGWEMFFFALDSPYAGHGFLELLTGPQLDPARSNLAGMWHDFWQNPVWRHAEVVWAMGETILMAFLGTLGAALVALPLAFLGARNFAPLVALRVLVRRVFDFARGVDGLIWTILLSRAFGPGPMTGSLAILLTDTGTFGKLFSEALENVDTRQVEGVRSTGANTLQRYRFGVMPQIMPVLLSQVLYYFESNTRSATIIGAITGGGIGLLLTQAIQTQKDWEEVSYYMILIILMVIAMDSLSGWLRRRMIQGREQRMARLKADAPFLHPDTDITESRFGAYVEIGRGTRVAFSSFGDYSYCDRYADIANAEIGKFANIAAFVRIGPTDHPMDKPALHHFLYRSADLWDDAETDAEFFARRRARIARVGHDTWIGHGAVIRPEVTVGHGAVVATMAVVTHDVPPYQIVAGIPARPMRARFPAAVAGRLMALAWWDWDHATLRARLDDFRHMPTEAFLEKYEAP